MARRLVLRQLLTSDICAARDARLGERPLTWAALRLCPAQSFVHPAARPPAPASSFLPPTWNDIPPRGSRHGVLPLGS
jgi:hypothetical protein